MKKLQTKSGKFNFIHYFLTFLFLSFTSILMAQNDKVKTAEDIEYERQFEERQRRLTQQCTEKMLELLREAPIVVEGIFKEEKMERSIGMIGNTKYRYFCLKVIVSQVLKGNPILRNDTLFFTRRFVPLDANGNEIYSDHGFSPGLYPDKPIILMLKPNDDVNSPFYNDSRKNYITYDPVQPSIGYDFFREGHDDNNPKIDFRYIFEDGRCSKLIEIKEVNKLTRDIPNFKPIQKKSPESVSLRSGPTISSISPLETTADR